MIHEIELLFQRICQYQPAPGSPRELFFIRSIFKPFEDKAKKSPQPWAKILQELVHTVKKITAQLDKSLSDRWDADIFYEEAVALNLMGKPEKALPLVVRGAEIAIREKCWGLGYDASFLASFPLWKHHQSFFSFAKSNYDLFLCTEGLGLESDRLEILGLNMFRFWSKMGWNRLSTADMRIKDYLNEPAKELLAPGFTDKEAAPVMVALLLRAFNHEKEYRNILKTIKPLPEKIAGLLA